MNRWFQKGNARRFYRIDMPLKTFIIPKTPIQKAEIYATGTDYFPPSVMHKIEQTKQQTLEWINLIQDQREKITLLFNEAIDSIEFFGRCIEKLSFGQDPRNNMDYWARIKQLQKGFQTIQPLKESAPKTFQYFKLIEEKYLSYLNSMVKSIQKSTPQHFYVDPELPDGFRVDKVLIQMEDEKFSRIPLVQAIVHLGKLINAYAEVYRRMIDDNYLKQYPKEWKTYQVNVSASGLAIQLDKRYKQYDKLDVYFYLPSSDQTLHFDASVVNIRTLDKAGKERIAVNFDFPDGHNQIKLQNEIQKYEIRECFEIEI